MKLAGAGGDEAFLSDAAALLVAATRSELRNETACMQRGGVEEDREARNTFQRYTLGGGDEGGSFGVVKLKGGTGRVFATICRNRRTLVLGCKDRA